MEDHPYAEEVRENSFESIVGSTPIMKKIYEKIIKVSRNDASVNIIGESGTGKELVARAIHKLSGKEKFYAVNCASYRDDDGLLRSELFGIGKGKATHVYEDKGILSYVGTGTLFLDEIADMTGRMQDLLLRVLQERKFSRIGEQTLHNFDGRIITAASKNLADCVNSKNFRQDLYYRINVVPIYLPPLRERNGDIDIIAKAICVRLSERYGMFILDKKTFGYLQEYNWPGNVRELEQKIKGAISLHDDENSILYPKDFIELDDTGETMGSAELENSFETGTISEFEKRLIKRRLISNCYIITETARSLGISRSTLYKKMHKYGLEIDSE